MIHKGNNQRWPEFHTWACLCLGMGVKTYLELGCGSTGHMRLAGIQAMAIDLKDHRGCIDHIHGNTHDPAMVETMLNHFYGEPDAIFIDAGHEYHEAKADFDLWYPHARMVVGFHDILLSGVSVLWQEIRRDYPCVEIIARDVGSAREWQRDESLGGDLGYGGIGVIFKSKP